jgi:hypothetical protein
LKNNRNKWKSSGNNGMFVASGKQRVLFNPGYLVKLLIVRGNCSFPLEGYPDLKKIIPLTPVDFATS